MAFTCFRMGILLLHHLQHFANRMATNSNFRGLFLILGFNVILRPYRYYSMAYVMRRPLHSLLMAKRCLRTSGSILYSSISVLDEHTIPILFDSTNGLHRDIRYHPEQPSRIQKCVEALHNRYSTNSSIVVMDVASEPSLGFLPSSKCRKDFIRHQPLTDMELDYARSILVKTHSEEHVSNLESTCRRAKQRRIEEGKNPLGFSGYIDADTFLTTESYNVCLRATAAWIRCIDYSCRPRTNDPSMDATLQDLNKYAAFALTRPPGHHATKGESNGFCIFNFAAAAAIHAVESGMAEKVSILDWDVHYGQGVTDIIQHYPDIRYVSIHQSPAFPYQGNRREIVGQYQNILTIPLSPDSSWSCGYKAAFEQLALPFVIHSTKRDSQEDGNELKDKSCWIPNLVIVCAGYDALLSDELASCNLSASDYGQMTRMLKDRLGRSIVGLVMGLEGGYQLNDDVPGGNLADAVLETIHELH